MSLRGDSLTQDTTGSKRLCRNISETTLQAVSIVNVTLYADGKL